MRNPFLLYGAINKTKKLLLKDLCKKESNNHRSNFWPVANKFLVAQALGKTVSHS